MSARLSLIGCGAAARRLHMPALRAAGADIVCFASRTRAAAESAAARWGSGDVTDDWRKAIDRDDCDGVVVCTPNALHAPMAIAAADAGKHVLVEKPMATSLPDADRMIAAAEGLILVPAHNARFAPPVAAARDAIASLGEVRAFSATLAHPGPLAWSETATWFFDPSLSGGGALLDLGVHLADALRAVLGDEITEVTAIAKGAPIDTSASVAMRTSGGATGSMHVSWESPVPRTELTILGTGGVFHFDLESAPSITYGDGRSKTVPLDDASNEPYAGFVRACGGTDEPPVTAEDGRAALAVVLAAAYSARTGTTVTVD